MYKCVRLNGQGMREKDKRKKHLSECIAYFSLKCDKIT